MSTSRRGMPLVGSLVLMVAATATAQTTEPPPAPAMPEQGAHAGDQQSSVPFPPPKDWPAPVEDEMKHTFLLSDVAEFRPRGDESDFRWDIEGWRGGDFDRMWVKTEGEQSRTRAERDIDLQLLYGRFVRRFYDLQLGGRVETKTFRGAGVTRGQVVVGIEGFVPFLYEVEAALFVSHQGDVSGRFTFTRDFLMTQRWVFQARIESNLAVQRVVRFGVGTGLNDLELGLRLRYEFRRAVGAYVGVAYDRSFFGTADLARQDGRDPGQARFVAGVRAWR